MSALPPKADIAERDWNVRFVPKADIQAPSSDVRFTPKSGPGTGPVISVEAPTPAVCGRNPPRLVFQTFDC